MKKIKILVCLIFAVAVIAVAIHESTKTLGQASVALSAPASLTATQNLYSNKIGLHWDAVRGAANYRLFRSSVNDPATAGEIGLTASNTFFDLSGPSGQDLFYWARAENASQIGEFSNSATGRMSGTQQQGPVPPLQPPPIPVGNEITAAKVYLGKALFWDEQMSSTGTVACGTCHHSAVGGTDPRSAAFVSGSLNPGPDLTFDSPDDVRGSAGVPANNADGTFELVSTYGLEPQVTGRRSMPYINAGYSPVLFWDGRALGNFRDPVTGETILNNGGALESQIIGPPLSTVEMAHTGRDWDQVAAKIAASKPLALSPQIPSSLDQWIGGRTYPELFDEAFGTADVTPARIALAIATFERSLFSDQAPIDLAAAGIAPLTLQEQRGRGVFNASSCNVCHAGPLFTDNSFRYIGVRPQNEDTGRFQVTGIPGHLGEFRTPSLRNVELRKSYFHNGKFTSLEEVVAFYNRGGDFNAPNKPNNLIRPLGLSAQQMADLVAFLRRPLTDPRVAAEAPPFDRPLLFTESDRVPQVIGTGTVGTGAQMPQIKAISAPISGNPNFVISLSSVPGNAETTLVIDGSDPGESAAAIPISGSFARIVTRTLGVGPSGGWVSSSIGIPQTADLDGKTFYARWYTVDPEAVSGFSVSPAVRFTIFGAASVVPFKLSGRVLSPDGRGLRNAAVSLSGPNGQSLKVSTGSLGYFEFDGLASVGRYSVSVISKRYRFASKTFDTGSAVFDLIFIGEE